MQLLMSFRIVVRTAEEYKFMCSGLFFFHVTNECPKLTFEHVKGIFQVLKVCSRDVLLPLYSSMLYRSYMQVVNFTPMLIFTWLLPV